MNILAYGKKRMNKLMGYLLSLLGQNNCPIIMLDHVTDFSENAVWKEYYVIKLNDGTTIKLIEKPQ